MPTAIRTIFPPSFYNNQDWLSRSPAARYAASYWEGAVRIDQGNFLEGDALASGNFTKFVCSFWATNLTLPAVDPGPPFPFQDYYFNFALEGTHDTFGETYTPFLVANFVIQIQSNGDLLLMYLDPTSTFRIGTLVGCPDIMGWDHLHHRILPAGVWHHYIMSFDAASPRCQMACDRGGGRAWGGGPMDTDVGILNSPTPTFHSGTAPQPMWSGALGGPSSFTNPSPSSFNWRMQAPTSSLIDIAYFYFGISDTFFDLTAPGNLDYFVTPVLTPVNLGIAGGNVPLTCLIMHTGNASIQAADFRANDYSPSIVYTIGDTVFFNGSNYTSLIINNLNNQPNTSPQAWLLLNSVLQFQYNAATGRLWGGTITDAPTQPPTGT